MKKKQYINWNIVLKNIGVDFKTRIRFFILKLIGYKSISIGRDFTKKDYSKHTTISMSNGIKTIIIYSKSNCVL